MLNKDKVQMTKILYLDNNRERGFDNLSTLEEIEGIEVRGYQSITEEEFQQQKVTLLLIHGSNQEKSIIRNQWWKKYQPQALLVIFSGGNHCVDRLSTSLVYLPARGIIENLRTNALI